jgi:hypothetical protein
MQAQIGSMLALGFKVLQFKSDDCHSISKITIICETVKLTRFGTSNSPLHLNLKHGSLVNQKKTKADAYSLNIQKASTLQ